jgi:hypothetical protein
MPRPQKNKKPTKPIADVPPIAVAKHDRPPVNVDLSDSARMAREVTLLVAGLCSTKMDVAFIAAEMLLHLGRGQMAAQLGHNFSHLSNSDLATIRAQTAIFEFPSNPNQESTVEKLFLGFVKSVANNDPALKKQRWKTAGNSDLPLIAALSFLVGNLAWQNRATGSPLTPPPPMTRQNVKDAFDAVSGTHCPASGPQAGGGRFCDWMDL